MSFKKFTTYYSLALFGLITSCLSQDSAANKDDCNRVTIVSIIPQVQELKIDDGYIEINENSSIYYDAGLESEAHYFQESLKEHRNMSLRMLKIDHDSLATMGDLVFRQRSSVNTASEAYRISTETGVVELIGYSAEGVFRGMQSLIQVIPLGEGGFEIPKLYIRDQPNFEHRGLLLDCSRHFFSVEVIKKHIDLLARYKMNVLHWHLTEDQGWRIEIDAYPLLTEVGAWRSEPDGSRYGGFYSKEQIRDIVSYAAQRHITVIPEIELPGHSLAALAAYPRLACTEGPFEVTNEWGVFKDVYCAGNDSTFLFLETVLMEVMELFPSPYIHIGGDESPKYRWEHCNKCKGRIRDEGLHDEDELQSYFIRRVQDFLSENGREIIGWDEILEGGLAPGSIVQSWRGMDGAIAAAETGNKAIMSPTSHCYLDYGLQSINLEKIYSFNPIPEELDGQESKFILGAECNMWTEHVPNEDILDRQIMPRMIGLAEVLWTYDLDRNYEEFTTRLQTHYPFLESKSVAYGYERIPYEFSTKSDNGKLYLRTEERMSNMSAVYSSNGTPPDSNGQILEEFTHVEDNLDLVIRANRAGRPYPDLFNLSLSDHLAIDSEIERSQDYHASYAAGGDLGLIDGFKGSLDFRDGHWQGYSGVDVIFDLKLDTVQLVNEIEANFYQYNNAWIFPAKEIRVSFSVEGQNYTQPLVIEYDGDQKNREKSIYSMSRTDLNESAQFVRFEMINPGPLPDWHDAAGSDSWLFIDELIVR